MPSKNNMEWTRNDCNHSSLLHVWEERAELGPGSRERLREVQLAKIQVSRSLSGSDGGSFVF